MKYGILFLLLALLAVSGCSGPLQPVSPPATDGQTPVPAALASAVPTALSQGSVSANTVMIRDFTFSPETVTVKAGEIVRWENHDSTPHRIMFTDASGRDTNVESSALAPSQSYSRKFNTPGTFPYYCKIHPSMKGNVIVE